MILDFRTRISLVDWLGLRFASPLGIGKYCIAANCPNRTAYVTEMTVFSISSMQAMAGICFSGTNRFV